MIKNVGLVELMKIRKIRGEWITGEKWEYTNWHSVEPSNGNSPEPHGEDYLQLFWYPNGLWNDAPNAETLHELINVPLCEWENIPTHILSDLDKDGVIDIWDLCTDTPLNSCANKNGCIDQKHYNQEQMNQVINSMLNWDKNKDGKIDLIEAINILQESAGVPIH